MRKLLLPDLDQYNKNISDRDKHGFGCSHCCFFKMSNVKCSAIQCTPTMGSPHHKFFTPKKGVVLTFREA